jgi:hypothetical protein
MWASAGSVAQVFAIPIRGGPADKKIHQKDNRGNIRFLFA